MTERQLALFTNERGDDKIHNEGEQNGMYSTAVARSLSLMRCERRNAPGTRSKAGDQQALGPGRPMPTPAA
jgi:hypothetical protein